MVWRLTFDRDQRNDLRPVPFVTLFTWICKIHTGKVCSQRADGKPPAPETASWATAHKPDKTGKIHIPRRVRVPQPAEVPPPILPEVLHVA